jgi:trehalose 6-phosphate synthase/phosphatase
MNDTTTRSGGRLLLVSNRLPVTVRVEDDRLHLTSVSGGLASGLVGFHATADAVWIGWPGDLSRLSSGNRAELDEMLGARGIVPVELSAREVRDYYEGFSNGVLWPLFHYLLDRIPLGQSDWQTYRQVNQKFADRVVRHYREGDRVWVHDYQLMLVPGMVRERLPGAQIGFFLHIPFPSSEVFRILPWRKQVLEGLLGADLIGFHTYGYLRHFSTSLIHLMGLEAEVDRVIFDRREVRFGVFPLGIDAAGFETLARDPEVIEEAASIRASAGDRHLFLGIDRLDYTKGIPRRLLALERLIDSDASFRDRIRLIQIAVPSRTKVESYRHLRSQVEELVGRINGARGTLESTPIHYLYRSVTPRRLVALYKAADVMLVTPLRDGMNLVAKEFVASRVDEDGVLLLSEFAGASSELAGALLVNPYDVDGLAGAMKEALTMDREERQARMVQLRRRVLTYTANRWADQFVQELSSPAAEVAPPPADTSQVELARLVEDLRKANRLSLILDYDGTLVPIESFPDLAVPDRDLLDLLTELAARPATSVMVASGRDRETLERWLGRIGIGLAAEHGFWTRAAPGEPWEPATQIPPDLFVRVRPIFEQFTADTPGSFIEEKTTSMAWHYRLVDPEFGERQAHELRMMLGDALSNQPLEVLENKRVIEVRLGGAAKSRVLQRFTNTTGETIVAMGDDRTDEDLFAALAPDSVSIHVGDSPTRAPYRIADWSEVRRFLEALLR